MSYHSMSPERPPSIDSGPMLESPNMVLSSIPLESGHIILQQQQNGNHIITNGGINYGTYNPNNNINHQSISPSSYSSTSSTTSSTTSSSLSSPSASPSSPALPPSVAVALPPPPPTLSTAINTTSMATSSKLVVLQPNQLKENYVTTSESNGIGNIVLLATEQMDIGSFNQNGMHTNHLNNNNSTDEELTSLTWLHDKNLLKGINLTCTSATKSTSDSSSCSPGRLPLSMGIGVTTLTTTGTISPTSDYVDDSCVSEDNASSANSCSDQGIGNCSMDTSPISNYGGHYATLNNNTINKNRNHIMPLITSSSSSSLSPSSMSTAMPSEIIFVAADGSIIDNKTISVHQHHANRMLQHHQQQHQHQQQQTTQSSVITSSLSATSSSIAPSTVITSTHSTTSTAPGHQHFHKKYLREEHNKTLKLTNTPIASPINQLFNNSSIKLENDSQACYDNSYVNSNSYNHTKEGPQEKIIDNFNSSRETIPPSSPQSTAIIQQQQLSPQSLPSSSSSITTTTSHSSAAITKGQQQKIKHPTNLPYDPLIHTTNKPPLSFSSLIYLAIEDSTEKALPVKEIYAWIVAHYPYFKTAPTGWKNSVRHNLSLNKCFQKVEKAPNMGKGSLWRVEQQYKPNLIQALTRSSYHPCTATIDKTVFKTSPRPSDSPPSTAIKTSGRHLDADLFPRLSKCMAAMINDEHLSTIQTVQADVDDLEPEYINNNQQEDQQQQHHHPHTRIQLHTNYVNGNYYMNNKDNNNIIVNGPAANIDNSIVVRDWGTDSIDDVNAATAMLALKHGPKVFSENFHNGNPPVITSSPSEDHTYSAGGIGSKRSSNNNSDNNSNGTSSDAAYESSEESQQNHISKEELEARRHAEGVDAFLTFATEVSTMSSPIKRPPSPDSRIYIEHVATNNIINNNNNNHYEPISIINHQQSHSIHHNQTIQQHQHQQQQQQQQQQQSQKLLQQHPHYLAQYAGATIVASATTPTTAYLSSPTPPKKSRSRTLRTKLKKRSWFR